jgi:hypothetical protein
VWTMTANGDLPCVRVGRSKRYDPRDLDRWIKEQKKPK